MFLAILVAVGIGAWSQSICGSCFDVFSGGDINFTMEGYKEAVKSGRRQIPEANQIEELFGESDHFIGYHGDRSIGNDWNTEVHFYGRYALTMQVDVKMPTDFNQVEAVLGEPKFYLIEVGKVRKSDTGQIGANIVNDFKFNLDDWKKVYKAKGDFGVIGLDIKKGQPVKDFDLYVQATRKDRPRVEFDDPTTNDSPNKDNEDLK